MLRHSLLFFFFVDLVTFCIAKLMFLPSLTSEMSLNNFFFFFAQNVGEKYFDGCL